MELKEIRKWFDTDLKGKENMMLREYLQYEILKIIFASKHGNAYTFIGGTCLRIINDTDRFSEDLDFDNIGLEKEDFEETGEAVRRGLELLGYETRIKFAYKGAFHCKVTFPNLLFNYQLSGHKEAGLYIKLDTEKQHFEFERDLVRISKFGVTADIFATPQAVLCSQKIAAVMGRKRPKGRDFYDLTWLLNRVTPDYRYLDQKLGVTNEEELRELVNGRIENFDFLSLTKDVEPFIFVKEDLEFVRNFPKFWATCRLS